MFYAVINKQYIYIYINKQKKKKKIYIYIYIYLFSIVILIYILYYIEEIRPKKERHLLFNLSEII